VENITNNPGTGAPAAAPSEISSGNNESGGRTINDMGPSYYADALPSAGNGSLGELSAHYKALKGTVNARMLTNDDVQQMVANKNGVTVAKNMPPLGQGSLEQSGTAQNAGPQSSAQNAQTGSSANQQGQNAANSQGGTPPPAQSGVSAENSTTPQINQKQQSNDAQGSRRLPATATILPLLGLLGLVSGGIGFWFRKFRK
jgi:cobalamin biosynthesis Mg chelatase CobN